MRHVFSWQPPLMMRYSFLQGDWVRAAMTAGLMFLCASGLAFAQGSAGKAKGKAAPGAAGGHGGSGGGMFPGSGSGAGMQRGFGPQGAAKKAAPPKPAPVIPPEPVDPATGLPLTFTPKKDAPDLMALDQPIASEETIAKWKREYLNKYRIALRNGDLTANGKATITHGIKYRIAVMTLKENQQNLAALREALTVGDLPNAGLLLAKDTQIKEFRRWVMEEVLREAAPLLENQYYVRIHGATLLGELALTEVHDKTKLKLETYTPPVELLRKTIRDPEQPLPVKIAATRSIVRLVRYGDLPANKRFDTAKDVLAELAQPAEKTHYWYQMRLVEALSTLDAPLDLETRKPVIVPVLTRIVTDPKMDWHVRAEAARALGRTPIDPQVNISNVLQDLTQFALEMSKKAQQQPKSPQWKMTFFKLYLAFQPLNAEDRDATKKGKAGLLNNPSAATAAKQPYGLIVPIVNAVINDQAITAAEVKGLEDWIAQTRPRAGQTAQDAVPPTLKSASPVGNGGRK